MSDTMFTFYKDQWGCHVYYAGRDNNPESMSGLLINSKIEFDCGQTCVVPPVKSISRTKTETQNAGYVNGAGKVMSEVAHDTEKQNLTSAIRVAQAARDENAEIAATIQKRNFDSEWTLTTKEVDVDTEYNFEVIDIEYPADERLVPLRHLPGEQINYFQVNGKQVVINLLHKLCQGAGLNPGNGKIREYTMHDYHDRDEPNRIMIEGLSCSGPLQDVKLNSFTGHLQECREYLNEVEGAARACFDLWVLAGKSSVGLTVGFLTKHLDNIRSYVYRIDSKIKTQRSKEYALQQIELARNEILAIGMQEVVSDENNSDDEDTNS